MAKEDKSKQGKPERKPASPQQAQKPKKEAQAPKKEAPAKAEPQMPAPPARLATHYQEKVVPDLMQKFGYKTVMQVPRLASTVLGGERLNCGRGRGWA